MCNTVIRRCISCRDSCESLSPVTQIPITRISRTGSRVGRKFQTYLQSHAMTLFKQLVKHQTIPERPCIRRGILRNQQSAKREFRHTLLLAVSGNLSDLVSPQRSNIIGIFRGIRLHFRRTHRVRQQPLILQTRQNLPRKVNTGSHHLCPVFIARVIYFIQNIIPV